MSFYNVKIYHGPCTSFHSLEHKPQKLVGLTDRLQKLGYQADLIKVPYVNYCMLQMCDHEVFRCNLKHLQFSTQYVRDVVAQRAIDAVLQASASLRVARNHLWFRTLINEEMFARGPYAPKDYWPKDVEIKPYSTCSECVACCEILIRKKEIKEHTESKCFAFHIYSETNLPNAQE